MKHYKIKKSKNGWWEATVIRKNSICPESYRCFYSKEEAELWCYAKINCDYGAKVANEEFFTV